MHIQIYHNFFQGVSDTKACFFRQMEIEERRQFIDKVWNVVEKALCGFVITFALYLASSVLYSLGSILPLSIAVIGSGLTFIYPMLSAEGQDSVHEVLTRVKDAIDMLFLGREEFIRRRIPSVNESL